jgi:hypothetical protein
MGNFLNQLVDTLKINFDHLEPEVWAAASLTCKDFRPFIAPKQFRCVTLCSTEVDQECITGPVQALPIRMLRCELATEAILFHSYTTYAKEVRLLPPPNCR